MKIFTKYFYSFVSNRTRAEKENPLKNLFKNKKSYDWRIMNDDAIRLKYQKELKVFLTHKWIHSDRVFIRILFLLIYFYQCIGERFSMY